MTKVRSIADPKYVNTQYRDGSNLNARIRLHQEFSTNKYGWQRWLFDHFKFPENCRVLELGCGAGNLWLENLERIPVGAEVILSDLSAGMVDQAKHNLSTNPHFENAMVVDAQSIPFDRHSFDIVIANHMLFHVPEIDKALREIKRILKPDGCVYASTTGCNHLKELTDLVSRFDKRLSSWGKLPTDSFTLENGGEQLRYYFNNISLSRYPDSLIVTDINLLLDYIFSGRLDLSVEERSGLAMVVSRTLKANNGKFNISKDVGVFEASNIS